MSRMITTDLRGIAVLQERLAELLQAGEGSIEAMGNFIARSTAIRAKNLIAAPGRSGRTYFREDPDRFVVASAPGESPLDDTGTLKRSITFKLFSTSGMVGYVGSDSPYAGDLEYGSATIAARPFLQPAFLDALEAGKGRFKAELDSRL